MPKVLVYTYEGCEPVEALGTVDVLRRAGAEVIVYGKTDLIKMGHGINVKVDTTVIPAMCDCIVLPGGMGWKNLQADAQAKDLTKQYIDAGKLVAAICAAPSVALGFWGFLDGKRATCYPSMESIGLLKAAKFCEDRVVVDGQFITSRGPGTALEFGLEIANQLKLDAGAIKKAMLVQ